MMFKYFNCFFSSFFRTLGRIIVYILLGLVFSTILSKIDVHARTILGDIEIGDWSSFTNGAFYNIVSTDNIQNKGWDLDSSGMAGPTSSIPTIMDSYGMGMSICDLSLLTDNYYSFTLLIGSDSDAYYHPFYVNRSTKLGISNNSSVWFTNFDYDNLSDGVQQNYISFGQSQHIYLNSFTGIFKAPTSGTCLNLAFSSNKTLDFYRQSFAIGYRLTSLGSKPLTESQISSALSNDFDNLNNSINNSKNDIIDNQNNNTDKVIDNQNNNTDKQIDSQKVCNFYDKNSISLDNYILSTSGVETSLTGWGVTDFLPIFKSSDIILLKKISQNFNATACFYNINKSPISCVYQNDLTQNQKLTVPENSSYIRFTINKSLNEPHWKICQNGNQAISGGLNDINGSLNNSDSSGATNDASNFFNDFTTDLHGLTGIITAPLNAINSLTNKTCSPLVLPLPFVDKDLTLPCMRSIYDEHFGDFMTLYDTITFGIVSYWVCVRIFSLVKDFKNPEHDEIEVVDL